MYPQQPLAPIRMAPPLHHTWVAEPGDHDALALASVKIAAMTPAVVAVVGLTVILALLDIVSGSFADTGGLLLFLVVFVLAFPIALYLRAKKVLAATAYPGAVWALGFDESSIVLVDPRATAVVAYDMYCKPRRRFGVVTLRNSVTNGLTVLPAELVPELAFAHLRSRLAS